MQGVALCYHSDASDKIFNSRKLSRKICVVFKGAKVRTEFIIHKNIKIKYVNKLLKTLFKNRDKLLKFHFFRNFHIKILYINTICLFNSKWRTK